MMVRALLCNLDPVLVLQMTRQGFAIYPEQVELLAKKMSLDDFSDPTSNCVFSSMAICVLKFNIVNLFTMLFTLHAIL
jgi:hypothetical protein